MVSSVDEGTLRVVPLGGLGEIGKNMMVIETAGDIVVVDCGLMFPEEEMLGVDLVVPDVSYLLERQAEAQIAKSSNLPEHEMLNLPGLWTSFSPTHASITL